MGRCEHVRILDAEARERVHVEETSIVDLVRRGSPVREQVRLRFEQLVQRVEAFGLAGDAVDALHGSRQLIGNRRALGHQTREPRSRDLFFTLTLGDLRGVLRASGRQVLERREDAQELVELRILRAEDRRQRLDRAPVDERRELRVDRHLARAVGEQQKAVAEDELQLAALQHAPVLIAENRQQQLRLKLAFTGVQSMSKNRAAGEPGPFSSTSFHHAFALVPMPMWFGTKSTMCPRPSSVSLAVNVE